MPTHSPEGEKYTPKTLPEAARMAEAERLAPFKVTKTYDEWKSHGFQVTKGMRGVGRTPEGVALFSIGQVYYVGHEEPEGT